MRITALAALILLLRTRVVVAQPACAGDDAEALVQQGIQRRRREDPEGALVCFEAAFQRSRTARTAGQLGFAEQQLRRWRDAATHLRFALAQPEDPWQVQNREALEGSLAAVERELQQHQQPPPPPSPPTPPPPPSSIPPPSSPAPQRGLSPLLWVGGGVAVAAAAAAIGVGVSGNAVQADYDARCVEREPDGSTDCLALQREAQSTLDDRALAVNVLSGVAALGVGVAVVGTVLSLRGARRASAPQVSVAVGPRAVGMTFTW